METATSNMFNYTIGSYLNVIKCDSYSYMLLAYDNIRFVCICNYVLVVNTNLNTIELLTRLAPIMPAKFWA